MPWFAARILNFCRLILNIISRLWKLPFSFITCVILCISPKYFIRRRRWRAVDYLLRHAITKKQRDLVFEAVCEYADDTDVINHVLPLCTERTLDPLLWNIIKRKRWNLLGKLFEQRICGHQEQWAILEAIKQAKQEEISVIIHHCSYDQLYSAVTKLLERGHYGLVDDILQRLVRETIYKWATLDDSSDSNDDVFWEIVRSHYHIDISKFPSFYHTMHPTESSCVFGNILNVDMTVCKGVFNATLLLVLEACFSHRKENVKQEKDDTKAHTIYEEMLWKFPKKLCVDYERHAIEEVYQEIRNQCSDLFFDTHSAYPVSALFQLNFIKCFLKHYLPRKDLSTCTNAQLHILSTVPFAPTLQSLGLKVMLFENRWNIIGIASMSHVWENVRRDLFRAAVEQRQWNVIKLWADYTLHDDVRIWAIRKALKDKQWGICLLLADHGLKEAERAKLHYKIVVNADWNTVLQMFERGASIREMNERIQVALFRGKKERGNEKNMPDACRVESIRLLESFDRKCLKSGEDLKRKKWRAAFIKVMQNPRYEDIHAFLESAIERKAWHVVMHIGRLFLSAAERRKLFPRMIAFKQWGVCRVLLDHGLDAYSCTSALPQLMEMNQWMLIARIVENSIGDEQRRKLMWTALKMREGSVVWQCIKHMKAGISLQEREHMFQQALTYEIWQALKPLIEVKDHTGIRHRDAVMLKAMEQHQWDLVDHCQRYHADIDVKDEHGETSVQRAARKREWKAVEELARRDANPSVLDTVGYTVLHWAIKAKAWNTVKVLVRFQANIHKQAEARTDFRVDNQTPLQMLCSAYQGKIIELSLFWCPDQHKGVSMDGTTPLHAASWSGQRTALYYLIRRGVDPLALTNKGESVLLFAVYNPKCPQKMVAECIRLGLSTHQRLLSEAAYKINSEYQPPFGYALRKGLNFTAQMLYESGSCSNRELMKLLDEYNHFEHMSKTNGRYLQHVASQPRSLKSLCRLAISHCLDVHGRRHRDVGDLPVIDAPMMQYIMFCDLADSKFGKDVVQSSVTLK